MKVRSITYFYSADSLDDAVQSVKQASKVLKIAKDKLVSAGFEVQTVRAASNSFEQFLSGSADDVVTQMQELEKAAVGVDFLSLGPVEARLDVLEKALSGHTEKSFFTVPMKLTAAGVPDRDTALRTAEVVCKLGIAAPAKTKDVPAVFRMTVTGNLPAGAPYFPGGYWEQGQPPAIAIALEDSGLFVEAFKGADSLDKAQQALEKVLKDKLVPLEAATMSAAEAAGVDYAGIDCSLASSASPDESLVTAYESLGMGRVGDSGTLSICAMITAVLKRLPVKRCGYSGLMLPVTEDAGLAKNCSEGLISVQQLLFYSAVCGTGIDTVAIVGDTKPERLAMVYMDMATLAFRLKKPLSARLWPVAGKKVGEMTEVDNAFFVNTKVLTVDPVPAKLEVSIAKPSVKYESVGFMGEAGQVLSDSAEALVLRLNEGCTGVMFVLRNIGVEKWPVGVCVRPLDAMPEEGSDGSLPVPDAGPDDTVTVSLVFLGQGNPGRYRLTADGAEFGPVVIFVK